MPEKTPTEEMISKLLGEIGEMVSKSSVPSSAIALAADALVALGFSIYRTIGLNEEEARKRFHDKVDELEALGPIGDYE